MQFLPALDRRRAGRVAVIDRPDQIARPAIGHHLRQLFGVERVDRLLVRHRRALARGRQVQKAQPHAIAGIGERSEEHTSELQSLMRISYAVFCLKKKKKNKQTNKMRKPTANNTEHKTPNRISNTIKKISQTYKK